jgi:hypothetical protein
VPGRQAEAGLPSPFSVAPTLPDQPFKLPPRNRQILGVPVSDNHRLPRPHVAQAVVDQRPVDDGLGRRNPLAVSAPRPFLTHLPGSLRIAAATWTRPRRGATPDCCLGLPAPARLDGQELRVGLHDEAVRRWGLANPSKAAGQILGRCDQRHVSGRAVLQRAQIQADSLLGAVAGGQLPATVAAILGSVTLLPASNLVAESCSKHTMHRRQSWDRTAGWDWAVHAL